MTRFNEPIVQGLCHAVYAFKVKYLQIYAATQGQLMHQYGAYYTANSTPIAHQKSHRYRLQSANGTYEKSREITPAPRHHSNDKSLSWWAP